MPSLGKTPRSSPEGNTEPLDYRTRAWCFTFNNWETHQPDAWDKFKQLGDYGCVAPEVAPTTGTPHLQGYLYFQNKKTKGKLIKLFPKCSFRPANGNAKENRQYIFGPYDDGNGKHKDFNPEAIEWGSMPMQGARADLDSLRDQIQNGTKVDDIAIENPFMYHQYGRTLNKIEDLMMRKKFRTEMTKGIWYFGKTGVGKSHTAFQNFNPETHYVLNTKDNGWWEGYTQQDTVIINDFRGELSYNELLQLVDKWPMTVKRRNREPMPFLSKTVIITSSLHPEIVYHRRNAEDSMEQFYRRFEVVEL